MAVELEFIDFIVPIAVIREKYPGGWEQCQKDHQNAIGRRIWFDNHLFRDGAMSGDGIQFLIESWTSLGFQPMEERDGQPVWKDCCVVEHILGGPTLPCDWIEVDGYTASLKGAEACPVVGQKRPRRRMTAKAKREMARRRDEIEAWLEKTHPVAVITVWNSVGLSERHAELAKLLLIAAFDTDSGRSARAIAVEKMVDMMLDFYSEWVDEVNRVDKWGEIVAWLENAEPKVATEVWRAFARPSSSFEWRELGDALLLAALNPTSGQSAKTIAVEKMLNGIINVDHSKWFDAVKQFDK